MLVGHYPESTLLWATPTPDYGLHTGYDFPADGASESRAQAGTSLDAATHACFVARNYSRPQCTNRCCSNRLFGSASGLPGSSTDLSTRALLNHPGWSCGPYGFLGQPQVAGFTNPGRLATTIEAYRGRIRFACARAHVFVVKRELLSVAWLRTPDRPAPHAWLPARRRPRLRVEEANSHV